MDVALWIVSGLLAVAYLAAGVQKAFRTEKYTEVAAWARDWNPRGVQAIGVLEILGAIGLILPPLLDIVPQLAAWAAVGLAAIQVGAIGLHLKRREFGILPVNLVLLAAAVFVAWVRLA